MNRSVATNKVSFFSFLSRVKKRDAYVSERRRNQYRKKEILVLKNIQRKLRKFLVISFRKPTKFYLSLYFMYFSILY